MLTPLASAVTVWLLLRVSTVGAAKSTSNAQGDTTIDICSKEPDWLKIAAGHRLFIVSPNHPMPVANLNMHCGCQIAAAAAATAADNSSSNGTAVANDAQASYVSITATVLAFNDLTKSPSRCWASVSTWLSSESRENSSVFCAPLNFIEEELVEYTVNSSEFFEIQFRREELRLENPVATFVLSINSLSAADLNVSCGIKEPPSVQPPTPTRQIDLTAPPDTVSLSSTSSAAVNTSQGSRPITTSGPIAISSSRSDDSTASSSDKERSSRVSGFSRNTAQPMMTSNTEPREDEESHENDTVKVIAISTGVAFVVVILIVVFISYEIITHKRRCTQDRETPGNDSNAPHRPDPLLCLPYAVPGVDDQWWPGAQYGCSSPSAASWPGTEFVGSTSAQRLPDSAFIGPQTLPRGCANRPPIPTPVLQVEMYSGERGSISKGMTASTFYDVIDPPQPPTVATCNESAPELAASAAVAALSESGRMTIDYSDYDFPDNIDSTYTDMGQGRRGRDKPVFALPLTTCYLSSEDGASGGHLPTTRSNTSVEDNIDQQQQEPAYDEPGALFDNESNQAASDNQSDRTTSMLSQGCDHYDRLPPFRNQAD